MGLEGEEGAGGGVLIRAGGLGMFFKKNKQEWWKGEWVGECLLETRECRMILNIFRVF